MYRLNEPGKSLPDLAQLELPDLFAPEPDMQAAPDPAQAAVPVDAARHARVESVAPGPVPAPAAGLATAIAGETAPEVAGERGDQDVQIIEAPRPDASGSGAPRTEARKRRRAAQEERAVAAEPARALSTAQPAAPLPAPIRSAWEGPVEAQLPPQPIAFAPEDWSRQIKSERVRWLTHLAGRIGADDLSAMYEVASPEHTTPVLLARFALFHEVAAHLGWGDVGRLMYAFVNQWQTRLTDPNWALSWWGLNHEVARRDPAISGRVQACFVAAYVHARGVCVVDRQAGGDRAAREVLAALAAQEGGSAAQKVTTYTGRCISFATACLDLRYVAPCTDRIQSILLTSFTAIRSTHGALHRLVRAVMHAQSQAAPPFPAAAIDAEQAVAGFPSLRLQAPAGLQAPSAGDGQGGQAR